MDQEKIKALVQFFMKMVDSQDAYATVIVSDSKQEMVASNMNERPEDEYGPVAFISLLAASCVSKDGDLDAVKFLGILTEVYHESYAKLVASRQFIMAATSEIQH